MRKLLSILILIVGLGNFTNSMAIATLTNQRDYYQSQLDKTKFSMLAYILSHPEASSAVIVTGGALGAFLQKNLDEQTRNAIMLMGLFGVAYCLNSKANAKECANATAELTSYKVSIDDYQNKIDSLNAQLSPNGSQSVGKGYSYHFTNKCKYPVRLAIRFVNLNNNWQTEGWWDVKAGEKIYLADSNNVRLKSNKSIWYFYAETTDGSNLVWTGDKNVSVGDRSLKMYKMKDSTGDSDWYINCPNK
jgi:hypothetical protein